GGNQRLGNLPPCAQRAVRAGAAPARRARIRGGHADSHLHPDPQAVRLCRGRATGAGAQPASGEGGLMAEIRLHNLAHSYSGAPKTPDDYAIREMNHVWQQGGAYALLGPSGCGKSTLLNIIS